MNHQHDPDSFEIRSGLRSIYDSVRFNKWVVALSCLITLGLLTLYVIYFPPVFRAEATLMVEREHDPTRDVYYASWDVFRKDDARTEMALLTSGKVLMEVIDKENLHYKDVYHPFMDHLKFLWDTSWPGKKYQAFKRWLNPPPPGELPPTEEEIDRGRTLEAIKKGIAIAPVAESNVGLLVVKAPSARASQIANTLLDTYLAYRRERHHDEAKTSFDVLDSEVARAALEVREAAKERLAFAEENGLAFDFNKELQQLQTLTQMEASIAANRSKIAGLEASLAEVERQLVAEAPMTKVSTMVQLNALRESAKAKRLELQMALIHAESRYRPDSPEVQEIRQEIGQIDKVIADFTENIASGSTEALNAVHQNLLIQRNTMTAELHGLRASVPNMEQSARRLRAHLATMPGLQQRMRELDTRFSAAHDVYNALLIKRAQTDVTVVTSKLGPSSMRVVDYAAKPHYKHWPKLKLLYPAGLMVGLLLGVVAAVLKSYFEGKISRGKLEAGLGTMPLYSTIPISTGRTPLTVVPRTDRGPGPPRVASEG